jgi:Asp-tRNA(Asn)/Glu-tRNA(Gln) amidotransferase B subunit
MRSKSNAISYRYFVEPNIINIDISNLVNQTQLDESKIPTNIAKKLHEDGVNNDIINQLLDDYDLYKAFKYALDKTGDVQMCIT